VNQYVSGALMTQVDGSRSFEINRQAFPTSDLLSGGALRLKRFLVVRIVFALCSPAEAQQAKKVPRIGYLSAGSRSSDSFRIEAFWRGLRELGYIEGKNVLIDYRFAEGRYDRFFHLAAELVSLKPDVIFTHTTPGALAAKNRSQENPHGPTWGLKEEKESARYPT